MSAPIRFDQSKQRNEILRHYSQFSFLSREKQEPLEIFWDDEILANAGSSVEFEMEGQFYQFVLKPMDWDSDFFGMKTMRIVTVLYSNSDYFALSKAINAFLGKEIVNSIEYWLLEIPSEDITLIQAFNANGFRLIETRMTYYLGLESIDFPRYGARHAVLADIPRIREVSREMKNPFDRFHAEPYFSEGLADDFLALYAENSIRGLADCVLVPDEAGVPADSFVSAKYLKDYWCRLGCNAATMVLSAVSSATNKGWYVRLISEMAYHLKDVGATVAFMHPASTNRAVIHTYEKLGCKLGQVSHVLTKHRKERTK